MGILDKVQIIVSALSNKSIDTIKSGLLLSNKLEISNDNYIRINGRNHLSDYYSIKDGEAIRDISLIKNVTFFKQEVSLNTVPQGIKLIIFRNKMIYFNQTLQSKIVKMLYNNLQAGTILIIGVKESLTNLFGTHEFSLIYSSESIYKHK
jgi:chemotaxis protein methyltransferase CheR